jgi:hypothetical protein
MRRKIVGAHGRAGVLCCGADFFCDRAAIKRFAARGGDRFERRRMSFGCELLARLRRASVRRKRRFPVIEFVEHHLRESPRPRGDRRNRIPIARVVNRRLEELLEREFPEL